MSQTETILLFVLGFALASLIALFMGRLLWTAAVRVGARRMQRQVPSTLVGLQTERDRLRAEYAMLSQRLGSRLEAAKLQMAEHMAEVSRHRNRVHEIETAEAGRNAEIRRLNLRVQELEDALLLARTDGEELRARVAALTEELAAAKRKRKVKAAPPQAEPAAATAAAPPPRPDDPELRLRQRIERLTELAKAGHAPDDVILAPAPADLRDRGDSDDVGLEERLGEAERQTADLTRDLERLDAEWQERLKATAPSPPPPAPEPEPEGEPAPDGEGNVIPLSNRIRDLKKSLGSSP